MVGWTRAESVYSGRGGIIKSPPLLKKLGSYAITEHSKKPCKYIFFSLRVPPPKKKSSLRLGIGEGEGVSQEGKQWYRQLRGGGTFADLACGNFCPLPPSVKSYDTNINITKQKIKKSYFLLYFQFL